MPENAPLHPWEWPDKPWSLRLHVDFAGPFTGRTFLAFVDSHSKWLEVRMMANITAQKTVAVLREIFATHGPPDTLVTDIGPKFTSADFQNFVLLNGIRHAFVSPYYPASNGLSERAVQTFKKSMKMKGLDLSQMLAAFLLTQHITPHTTTGVPPAELLKEEL